MRSDFHQMSCLMSRFVSIFVAMKVNRLGIDNIGSPLTT